MPNLTAFLPFLLVTGLLGGVGSVLRLAFAQINGWLPWGILLANSLASLLAALVASGFVDPNAAIWQTALVIGFTGGLSTFSSFAAQTFEFIREKKLMQAIANVFLNLTIPLFMVYAGIFLASALLK